jgi:hypothetical protein
VPAVTTAANHRSWYDNSRYHDSGSDDSRCYDNRRRGCYDDWSRGRYNDWRRWCDYDRTSIRAASSVRTRMKARTASAGSTGTINTGE